MKTADQKNRMVEAIRSGNEIIRRQLENAEKWTDEELHELSQERIEKVFDHMVATGGGVDVLAEIERLDREEECHLYEG